MCWDKWCFVLKAFRPTDSVTNHTAASGQHSRRRRRWWWCWWWWCWWFDRRNTHTHTHTAGQQHNPVKLMNGYTLGPFKQQMLIHFTWALSDHLCQATEYEWHRLSQIWGLCWQTTPSSRPLGNTPDYCKCVRACVKRCHYVCMCEGWCFCRRTRKPP